MAWSIGRLVGPFWSDIASDLGFWIVCRRDSRKLRRIVALRNWLLPEASVAAAAVSGTHPDAA
ncbi:hypothetical protein [Phenylobacterium sp.]|uniref:hypothetical protein n=1 Tax=Phenylobacterium sp. TaxID=1871053 RepID=UPI0025EBEB15|nr:hypothetical protein [Phenylobacterium sp.]